MAGREHRAAHVVPIIFYLRHRYGTCSVLTACSLLRAPLGRSASGLPTPQERVVVSRRWVKAKPWRALRGLDPWALRHLTMINTVEQSGQDDGGQTRSITELHADTVEFRDGRCSRREESKVCLRCAPDDGAALPCTRRYVYTDPRRPILALLLWKRRMDDRHWIFCRTTLVKRRVACCATSRATTSAPHVVQRLTMPRSTSGGRHRSCFTKRWGDPVSAYRGSPSYPAREHRWHRTGGTQPAYSILGIQPKEGTLQVHLATACGH